jgi:hypothetical protein
MKSMTCLQYVINGMTDRIFDFTDMEEGKTFVEFVNKWFCNRDEKIKELLVAYNGYYMVQAVIEARCMPKTKKSVIKFMRSKHYTEFVKEISNAVNGNFSMLMDKLSEDQYQRLSKLFS